jgi:hypothetical protein
MNTHSTKYRSCAIIVALLAITAGMQAQNPVYDVFPLEKGMRYTYDYKYQTWSGDCCSSQSEQDSGIVEYLIVDSLVVDDSTLLWLLLIKRSVIRDYYVGGGSHFSYPINDSLNVNLTETTTGNHELQSSSYIWNFPASSGNNICPIFRVADSTNSNISLNSGGCDFNPWHQHDSLWFAADSGLIKRYRYLCDGYTDAAHTSWLTSNLISRIKVSIEDQNPLPAQTVLLPNYPNPANPTTTISYELATTSDIVLSVYDLLGRKIATIAEGIQQPGKHQCQFDGSNIGSGVYIVRLQSPGFTRSNKLIILK